jgi:hypothetical protein
VVNRSEKPADEQFEERSRELFEESLERLDARTRSRLNQARHAALEELQQAAAQRGRWGIRWTWAPAGGLAIAAAVAFLLARPGLGPAGADAPPLDELDSVAGVENIELLQDVEFYAWLAEQAPQDANSG